MFMIDRILIMEKHFNIIFWYFPIIILINTIKHKLKHTLIIHKTKHSNPYDNKNKSITNNKLVKEYPMRLLFFN